MTNGGRFIAGDSRIFKGGRQRVEVIRGMTVAELATSKSPEAFDLLHAVIAGEDEHTHEPKKYPISQRLRAVEIILGYAFGKPVNSLQLQALQSSSQSNLQSLSTAQLLEMVDAEIAPANAPENAIEPVV